MLRDILSILRCIINTELSSCVSIIHLTSLGFAAGALKALVLQTRASSAPAGKPHDVQGVISTHSSGPEWENERHLTSVVFGKIRNLQDKD